MPHPHVFHSVPGSGSAFYTNPSIPSDPPGGRSVNEYVQRNTAPGVFIINYEDINSLSGPFRVGKVLVGTGDTVLPSGGNLERRRNITITNLGSETVYLSHEAATAIADRFPLVANGSLSLDLLAHFVIHAITASSTADIRILEIQ